MHFEPNPPHLSPPPSRKETINIIDRRHIEFISEKGIMSLLKIPNLKHSKTLITAIDEHNYCKIVKEFNFVAKGAL